MRSNRGIVALNGFPKLALVLHDLGRVVVAHELCSLLQLLGGHLLRWDGGWVALVHDFTAQDILQLASLAAELWVCVDGGVLVGLRVLWSRGHFVLV